MYHILVTQSFRALLRILLHFIKCFCSVYVKIVINTIKWQPLEIVPTMYGTPLCHSNSLSSVIHYH